MSERPATPRARPADGPRPRPSVPVRACVLLLLAGCVPRPTGPILGDWRGSTPGPYADEPRIVELVLDGAPDAASGRYHVAITVQNIQNGTGTGTTRWQGEWTGSRQAIDGRDVRIIRLQHMLDGEIDRYELAPDGTLRPMTGSNRLAGTYSAAQIAPYTLRPLRRDSWNYGVD